MGKPIVILGIFVADCAFRAGRMPKMGETILGNSFALNPGGKGSNQAIACARAGGDAHMITRLGADAFAEMADGIWQEAGVTPHVHPMPESYTGAAHIFIEEATGDNAIIVAPGAAGHMDGGDLEAEAELIAGAGVFITQLEQPLAAAHRGLEIAREAGVMTILNPAPAAELSDAMLGLCDLITPNESEAEALTGLSVTNLAEAEAAADALRARGAGAAIITLGSQGVLYKDGTQSLHQSAQAPGPVVETTGAGDAFNGGLATALAEGQSMAEALKFGCATAGISVTRAGAGPSMPKRAEIEAFLATF